MQDKGTTLSVLNWDRFKVGNLVLTKLSERLKKQLLGLASWNDFKNNQNEPTKAATGAVLEGGSTNDIAPVASPHPRSWGMAIGSCDSKIGRHDHCATIFGTSLEVQWLTLHTSTAGGTGSVPDRGTKIPHAA